MAGQSSELMSWQAILEYNILCLHNRNDLISFKFQQMFIEGQLTMLMATNHLTFVAACQHKRKVKEIAELKGFIL